MNLSRCIVIWLALMPVAVQAADTVRIMSLNIYGWKTMPAAASEYARLVELHSVSVLAIQEGADDWQIKGMPTDYSRAEALHAALGDCWQRQFQVFANRCEGAVIENHARFDLTDGPNAVRTGEIAGISFGQARFTLINIHWDHESKDARVAEASETMAVVEEAKKTGLPVVVLGDFNSDCAALPDLALAKPSGLERVADAGIDCAFATPGSAFQGHAVDAAPSDHPAVLIEWDLGENS